MWYDLNSFIIPDIFQIVDEDLDFNNRIFLDNSANSQACARSPNPGSSANTLGFCRQGPKAPRKGTYGPSRPLNPVGSHESRLR